MPHVPRWRSAAWCLSALVLLVAAPARGEDSLAELRARLERLEAKIERLERAQATVPEVRVARDALAVDAGDGEFAFEAGGRLMIDAARYDEDGPRRLGDGTEVRRARLFLAGRLHRDWAFKGQYDFAGNEVAIKDAYLRYVGFEGAEITLGHFKEPFGLEEMTSSKYVTFMERALPNTFAPSRNLGLAAHTARRGARGTWTLAAGAFGAGVDDAGAADEGYGLSARVTFAPIAESERFAHLGVAVGYRDPADTGVRFRERPETHATDTRLVDTGTLAGVADLARYGLEGAVGVGAASLQGEYYRVALDAPALDDPTFGGWYLQTSWFATGESRRYNARRGRFERVRPARPLGRDGGFGAVELAARLSAVDLSDAAVRGGEERNLTLGVNWYANANVRFMANYVRVLDLEATADPALEGAEPGTFQLRAQVDF